MTDFAVHLPESPVIAFPGPRQPIRVAGAKPLLRKLAVCLPDWRAEPIEADEVDEAEITVERTKQGYLIRCALFSDGAVRSNRTVYAAGAVAGALTSLYVAQVEDTLLLHAAATVSKEGLLIFLGDTLAGKSTLALQIASDGRRIFADDRLAIRRKGAGRFECLSLGVAAKARLPLPPACGAAFADFVETHCAMDSKTVAHLTLPAEIMAPLGETAPARALIVLDRRTEPTTASMAPLSASEILRDTLPKCLPSELSSSRLLQQAAELARALPGYRLTFSDSGAASNLLRESFP